MSLNKPCRIVASTNSTYLDPSQNIQAIADLNTQFLIFFNCHQREVFSEVKSEFEILVLVMYCSVYVFHPFIALLCLVLMFDPSHLKAGARSQYG